MLPRRLVSTTSSRDFGIGADARWHASFDDGLNFPLFSAMVGADYRWGFLTTKRDPPASPRELPSSPTGGGSLSGPMSQRTRERRITRESRALEFCALLAIVAVAWLTMPVAAGLLLGALMGFTLQPLYEAMYRRTGRPNLSSLTTVPGSALAIVGTVAGFDPSSLPGAWRSHTPCSMRSVRTARSRAPFNR